jgi:hypothetical protein
MCHDCLESSQNGADKREGKPPSREVVITVGGQTDPNDNDSYRRHLVTVETGIEEVPGKECGEKWCCSANNLVKLCNVNAYVATGGGNSLTGTVTRPNEALLTAMLTEYRMEKATSTT